MKKVLALIMAAMMILSIAPMALAADFTVGFSSTDPVSAGNRSTESGGYWTVYANREGDTDIRVYLQKDGVGGITNVSKADVDNLKVDVKSSIKSGAAAIKSVSIAYADNAGVKNAVAYVRIRFNKQYIATGDLDFEVELRLTQNKVRIDRDPITVEGTMKNYAVAPDLDADDDYVYVYDAPKMKAIEYIREIEIDTGVGLSVFAKMFEDKTYYCYASQAVRSGDEATIEKYPAIGSIYYLDTKGLNATGTYVQFDISDNLYVYNSDLKLIGRTNDEKLAFSTKYFIADKALDVASDVIDAPVDIPTNPNMGGNDVPVNVNDNPGTGC